MIKDIETFWQQVDTALNIKNDSRLREDFGEYFQLLVTLRRKIEIYDSKIPCDDFEKSFSPLINRAEALSKNITKRALDIISKSENASSRNEHLDFFAGCNTDDEIRKRYKALTKAFHPDVGGHHETFTIIQNQYEAKLEQMG